MAGGEAQTKENLHGNREGPYHFCISNMFSHPTYSLTARVADNLGDRETHAPLS